MERILDDQESILDSLNHRGLACFRSKPYNTLYIYMYIHVYGIIQFGLKMGLITVDCILLYAFVNMGIQQMKCLAMACEFDKTTYLKKYCV